jgi:uncharacterized protein YndB with AHSA1/START domain
MNPKIDPIYMIWSDEIMINASVKNTWKHVTNPPSWQNFPVYKTVSGSTGNEDEVILMRKEEEGFEFPSYFARVLKIEPERRIVWKTYPEKITPQENFFGIVDFKIHDEGGKTRFCYDFIYEFLVPHENDEQLIAFRDQQYENFKTLFSIIFHKLKALAERK